jgi:hypothetical protein
MFTVRNYVRLLWPLVVAVVLTGLALAYWNGRF